MVDEVARAWAATELATVTRERDEARAELARVTMILEELASHAED